MDTVGLASAEDSSSFEDSAKSTCGEVAGAGIATLNTSSKEFTFCGFGQGSAPFFCKPSNPAEGSPVRSEEPTSELQSLMRISYAVFCLKKNRTQFHQSTQLLNDYI